MGHLYENVETNYNMAKKYYLMAVEKNNHEAMNCLGNYYKNIENDYDKAKKILFDGCRI